MLSAPICLVAFFSFAQEVVQPSEGGGRRVETDRVCMGGPLALAVVGPAGSLRGAMGGSGYLEALESFELGDEGGGAEVCHCDFGPSLVHATRLHGIVLLAAHVLGGRRILENVRY